jgi:hypothetical protein
MRGRRSSCERLVWRGEESGQFSNRSISHLPCQRASKQSSHRGVREIRRTVTRILLPAASLRRQLATVFDRGRPCAPRRIGRLERGLGLVERGCVPARRPDLHVEHTPKPILLWSARSIDAAHGFLSIADQEVVDGIRGRAIGPGAAQDRAPCSTMHLWRASAFLITALQNFLASGPQASRTAAPGAAAMATVGATSTITTTIVRMGNFSLVWDWCLLLIALTRNVTTIGVKKGLLGQTKPNSRAESMIDAIVRATSLVHSSARDRANRFTGSVHAGGLPVLAGGPRQTPLGRRNPFWRQATEWRPRKPFPPRTIGGTLN